MNLEENKIKRAAMTKEKLDALKPLYDEKGFPIYNQYYIMIMEDGLPWCEPTKEHLEVDKEYEFNTHSLMDGMIPDPPISKEQANNLALMYKKRLEQEKSQQNNDISDMKKDILED